MVFVYGAKKIYDRAKKYKKRIPAAKARIVKEKERVSRFREDYFNDMSYPENNDSLLIVGALGLLYYGGKFVDKQTTKLSDSLSGVGNFNIDLPDFSDLLKQTPHDSDIQLNVYYPDGSVAPGASRDAPDQAVVDYITHRPGTDSPMSADVKSGMSGGSVTWLKSGTPFTPVVRTKPQPTVFEKITKTPYVPKYWKY